MLYRKISCTAFSAIRLRVSLAERESPLRPASAATCNNTKEDQASFSLNRQTSGGR
ncbi:hypothetical protein D3C81_2067150 [compost metagenome]